jgi:transketolase
VQTVDWTATGTYIEDVDALLSAVEAAKADTSRPSIIVLRTIIGWPAPNAQNTGKANGSALGDDEIAATKRLLGFDPQHNFTVEDAVLKRTRRSLDRGHAAHEQWQPGYDAWRTANPDRAALLDRLQARRLPDGWTDALPVFPADPTGMATRKASGQVLTALAPVLPELWGGSADLAESNNTTMNGEPSFVPANRQTRQWTGGPYGRTLHFGVREHAMGAILNGIALQSLTPPLRRNVPRVQRLHAPRRPPRRPYATARHLRLDPRLDRPGRGRPHPPAGGTPRRATCHPRPRRRTPRRRQRDRRLLAHHPRTHRPPGRPRPDPAEPARPRPRPRHVRVGRRGGAGRIRARRRRPDAGRHPDRHRLRGPDRPGHPGPAHHRRHGRARRVDALPGMVAAQPLAYRDQVLPPEVRARVSIEAGIGQSWRDIVGDAGRIVSLEHFGASADYQRLYRELGITPQAVAAAARDSIHDTTATTRPGGHQQAAAPTTGGTGDHPA